MTKITKLVLLGFLSGVAATMVIGIIVTKMIRINNHSIHNEFTQSTNINIPTAIIYETTNNLINLNSSSQEQLEQLPGIGPQKAAAIISFREKYGDYLNVDELLYVPGISKNLFDDIKRLVSVK